MLAADPELHVASRLAAPVGGDADQFADAVEIELEERPTSDAVISGSPGSSGARPRKQNA